MTINEFDFNNPEDYIGCVLTLEEGTLLHSIVRILGFNEEDNSLVYEFFDWETLSTFGSEYKISFETLIGEIDFIVTTPEEVESLK